MCFCVEVAQEMSGEDEEEEEGEGGEGEGEDEGKDRPTQSENTGRYMTHFTNNSCPSLSPPSLPPPLYTHTLILGCRHSDGVP